MYTPPAYMAMLRSRKTVPYVHDPSDNTPPRLIILSSDDDPSIPLDQRGRPVDSSYSDIRVKLSFMKKHGINCSVISLANPWLDFLPSADAPGWAEKINDDIEATCAKVNADADPNGIKRLATLPHIRGVIMGTGGLGAGLDDPRLDPIWGALEETRLVIFLHPHYGLPDEAFGGPEATGRYGHVLPLALGFPLETTIAVTRMLLSGVFDRFSGLQVLLAHSGGTLPFLAGRIESCILHERKFAANGGEVQGPRRSIWDVLQTNIYLDSVVYSAAGLKAAAAAGSADRLMFGTDHPFFPPLDDVDGEWPSVTTNYQAIDDFQGENKDGQEAILGGNAARILNLK
ncbi:hypothetical protein N7470_008712 [Penicillium chermesinum]|nr:hypothetical protein N7470_008712 [Penicillium chermesinum]